MKNGQPIGCRWICWLGKTAGRGLCVCPASEARWGHDIRKEQERRGDKTMNRAIWTHAILAGVFLVSASVARGQEAPPPPPLVLQPGEPGPEVGLGERFELLGFAGVHPGKVVKGAPFSATAMTDRTQTLADGTTIHRTTSSALYRDSYGRSRREVTLSGFGPL